MKFRDKRKSKSKDKKTLRAVKDADTTRANGDEPPNPVETRDGLDLVVYLNTDALTADSVSDSPANNAAFDDNETGENAAVCDSAGGGDGAVGMADDTLDGARAADDNNLGTGVADSGLQAWPASQPSSVEVEVVQHEAGVVQLGDLFLRR